RPGAETVLALLPFRRFPEPLHPGLPTDADVQAIDARPLEARLLVVEIVRDEGGEREELIRVEEEEPVAVRLDVLDRVERARDPGDDFLGVHDTSALDPARRPTVPARCQALGRRGCDEAESARAACGGSSAGRSAVA